MGVQEQGFDVSSTSPSADFALMLQVRVLQQRLRTLSCQLAASKAAAGDAVVDTVPGELIVPLAICCSSYELPCMRALPVAANLCIV